MYLQDKHNMAMPSKSSTTTFVTSKLRPRRGVVQAGDAVAKIPGPSPRKPLARAVVDTQRKLFGRIVAADWRDGARMWDALEAAGFRSPHGWHSLGVK